MSSEFGKVCVREEDAIRLILEFLSHRDLSISQLNLERESGVYNCDFSDDLIFLRQLILDGQWDDALQFVSPLESFDTFHSKRFRFIVYKHKFVELLCIRCEAGSPYQTVEVAVEDIIECLDKLEQYASDRDEYNHLSSLLTIPNLNDDDELKNWNPNSWRLKCFNDILPLVDKFMKSNNENSKKIAKNDRLMDLIFKGILYELCLSTATKRIHHLNTDSAVQPLISIEPNVFNGIHDKKLNINNLLQNLPDKYFANWSSTSDSFSLDITKHDKPDLVASWSEMILSTPIKPKIFPHIDVPYTRIKAADLMSKSLTASLMYHKNTKDLMTMSVSDIAQFSRSTLAATGFHLSNTKKLDQHLIPKQSDDNNDDDTMIINCDDNIMNKSIDLLFKKKQETNLLTNKCNPVTMTNETTTTMIIGNDKLQSNQPQQSSTVKLNKQHQEMLMIGNRWNMPAISEKATPIDDIQLTLNNVEQAKLNDNYVDDEQPFSTQPDNNNNPKDKNNNNTNVFDPDNAINQSYFKIWKTFHNVKNKLINNDGDNLECNNDDIILSKTGTSVTSAHGSTGKKMALKNRQESNKLARSMSVKSTASTCSTMSQLSEDSLATTLVQQQQPQLHQLQSNRFTTPVSKANKVITMKSTSSPSNPNTNAHGSNNIIKQRKTFVEQLDNDNNEYRQNDSNPGRCPNQPSQQISPSSSTTSSPIAIGQTIKHGIRTSPSILEQQHQHHLANHSAHHQSQNSSINGSTGGGVSLATTTLIDDNVQFVPIVKIREQQAIRTAEFHPNGKYYAVGSNSKLLRLFRYSSQSNDNNDSSSRNGNDYRNNQSLLELKRAEEIFVRTNYHRSSIYCLTWNKMGNLLATGSNDKTVKLLPFNPNTELPGKESEINVHNGTIRDICFMDDLTNGSSLLLSGGAGDCKIYITDCVTGTTFLSLSGHSSDILSMYTWGGAMFVSGSKDRTIRFWDLRTNSCINFVTCPTISRNKPGGAVSSVCVDPTGKLLVSGHEDSTCMLYDIRGGRVIQTFHPHTADIRTIRFSPKAYCLLTGSYDNNIALTDLKGDLTQPLQSIVIASHQDKVIQCRWHPEEWTFLSTSADKSVMLWTLPE